ncbi:MAG: hypothetical protein IT158_16230 [Bryobacterales bacterium]|nr:hypothetical protein [Bryobacterales bacterium]
MDFHVGNWLLTMRELRTVGLLFDEQGEKTMNISRLSRAQVRMTISGLAALLTFVIGGSAIAAGGDVLATQEYLFTSIDPPGSVLTFPVGINNNGLISIQYSDSNGILYSVILEDGVYTSVDVPGALGTLVSAPNMQGQVALGYYSSTDFRIHSAVYSHGGYTYQPDAPGFDYTSPSAINARGDISGMTWNGPTPSGYIWDGEAYTIFEHPASTGHYTMPCGINNQGQVVGQYYTADGVVHGFLKDGDFYTEIAFPGAPNTAAFSINNSGVVVGLYGEAGTGPFGFAVGSRGFILRKGTYVSIDYPGSLTSFPLGINDTGQIVGVYQDAAGTFHGYLATSR